MGIDKDRRSVGRLAVGVIQVENKRVGSGGRERGLGWAGLDWTGG
jgi:hypothetical protein